MITNFLNKQFKLINKIKLISLVKLKCLFYILILITNNFKKINNLNSKIMKHKFNKLLFRFEINLLLFKQFIIESKVFNFILKLTELNNNLLE